MAGLMRLLACPGLDEAVQHVKACRPKQRAALGRARPPAATAAQALVGPTGGGDNNAAPAGRPGDVQRVESFFAAGSAPTSGPTTAQLVQYYEPQVGLPPPPDEWAWQVRPRRHLRRRQVQVELPQQQEEGHQQQHIEQYMQLEEAQQLGAAGGEQASSGPHQAVQLPQAASVAAGLPSEQEQATAQQQQHKQEGAALLQETGQQGLAGPEPSVAAPATLLHSLQQAATLQGQQAVAAQHAEWQQQQVSVPHLSTQPTLQTAAAGAVQGLQHATHAVGAGAAGAARGLQQAQRVAQDSAAQGLHHAGHAVRQGAAGAAALTQRQLSNLRQAAQLAQRQLATAGAGAQRQRGQAPSSQPAAQQPQRLSSLWQGSRRQQQQQAAGAAEAADEFVASAYSPAVSGTASSPRQVAAASQLPQQQQQPSALPCPQQELVAQRQREVREAAPQPPWVSSAHQGTVAPAAAAAARGGQGQWAPAAAVLAGGVAVAGLLRLLRLRGQQARARQRIREAEQSARAAKLLERQRHRFQRALLAAEDLESESGTINSSAFTAGNRKGGAAGGHSSSDSGAAAGAAAAAINGSMEAGVVAELGAIAAAAPMAAAAAAVGAGARLVVAGGVGLEPTAPSSRTTAGTAAAVAEVAAAAGVAAFTGGPAPCSGATTVTKINPFLRGLAGGAALSGDEAAAAEVAAANLASVDGEEAEEEGEGSTDVFDPSSWDEETRRQWDAFVNSSKVNKGRLWDTSQVDEGLPEVWVDLNRD